MATVMHVMKDPWVAAGSDPSRRLVRGAGPGSSRPALRVYRRRRAVALVAVVAIALMAATVAWKALVGPGGGTLTTSGSPGAARALTASAQLYVVQPGDTLWSIVVARDHGADPRPEVDRLAMELGGRPLQAGDRIQLP
jgi:hypothetical protein